MELKAYEYGSGAFNLDPTSNQNSSMWWFYQKYATDINRLTKAIVDGVRVNGPWASTPARTSLLHLKLGYTAQKLVREKYSYHPVIKQVRDKYGFPDYMVWAYSGIESVYDPRSNALGGTFKGAWQIGFDGSNEKAYPGLNGDRFSLSDATIPQWILTNPPYDIWAQEFKSPYDPRYTAGVVYAFMDRVIDDYLLKWQEKYPALKAGKDTPFNLWGPYLVWNQGGGGASKIINAYFNDPNGNITKYAAGKNGKGANQSWGGTGLSVKNWVDAMRMELNLYYYIGCNACVARALNLGITPRHHLTQKEKIPYPTKDGKMQIDCSPTYFPSLGNSQNFAIGINTWVTKEDINTITKGPGKSISVETAQSRPRHGNTPANAYGTRASQRRANAQARAAKGDCGCGFVAETKYKFQVKYRKNEQATNTATNEKRRDWLYLEFRGNFDDKRNVLIYLK